VPLPVSCFLFIAAKNCTAQRRPHRRRHLFANRAGAGGILGRIASQKAALLLLHGHNRANNAP
jgi:hypothetical protein